MAVTQEQQKQMSQQGLATTQTDTEQAQYQQQMQQFGKSVSDTKQTEPVPIPDFFIPGVDTKEWLLEARNVGDYPIYPAGSQKAKEQAEIKMDPPKQEDKGADKAGKGGKGAAAGEEDQPGEQPWTKPLRETMGGTTESQGGKGEGKAKGGGKEESGKQDEQQSEHQKAQQQHEKGKEPERGGFIGRR